MSERLPYEDQLPQQLRDFPLPDEEAAWADMKRRLEEDDDDGVIVWWRRGCAGWGLLLLALIVTGWWVFTKDSSNHKKEDPTGNNTTIAITDTIKGNSLTNTTDTGSLTRKDSSASFRVDSPGSDTRSDEQSSVQETTDTTYSTDRSAGTGAIRPDRKQQRRTNSRINRDQQRQQNKHRVDPSIPSVAIASPLTTDSVTSKISTKDSAVIDRAKNFIAGDSSKDGQRDSIQKTPEAVQADSTKKDEKKKEKKSGGYFFSAGLALNQQLPIAGQKAVPYSSQGRQFSLADYIPSVYARFNKKDKWFIQGEFRYGAPQYNKPVIYFQQNDTIPNGDSMITERRLQKTYYHQLPFSFNFYINPQWAIGAGFVWNKFRKSVFEETLRSPQIDTLLRKETLVGRDPAAAGLSRSYLQALFESQYQWKKFSFGARYTFGLSPYLRFTLPGEPEQKERNQSLQIFIRYQLFSKNIGK